MRTLPYFVVAMVAICVVNTNAETVYACGEAACNCNANTTIADESAACDANLCNSCMDVTNNFYPECCDRTKARGLTSEEIEIIENSDQWWLWLIGAIPGAFFVCGGFVYYCSSKEGEPPAFEQIFAEGGGCNCDFIESI